MRIVGRGVVNSGEAGGPRAVATFPCIASLPDGDLLATYRVGSTKDSDDETIEIRRSSERGKKLARCRAAVLVHSGWSVSFFESGLCDAPGRRAPGGDSAFVMNERST